MILPGLSCETCGVAELLAVRPGTEPERAPGGFVLDAGQPTVGWCAAHWLRRPVPGHAPATDEGGR